MRVTTGIVISLCWLISGLGHTRSVAAEMKLTNSGPAVKGNSISQSADRPALDPAEIYRLVRELNHPLPSRRKAAARQLARCGPVVIPELQKAIKGGELEAALAAKKLLVELQAVFLFGADVQLRINRSEIRWDEPFKLEIIASNPTAAGMRIPWSGNPPTTQAAEENNDKSQVVGMLTVADWLTVKGPSGDEIELRHEPIARDPAIEQAVRQLAEGDAPFHKIIAGEHAVLTIPAFNRGWMRFPMLAAGEYSIRFRYQPQWDDSSWIEEGIGLVKSEPVTAKVTQSAPAVVRKFVHPMRCHLVRKNNKLVVNLENTWDRRLWINSNIGSEWPSHAKLSWVIEPVKKGRRGQASRPSGNKHFTPFQIVTGETGPRFQTDRVMIVTPGEKIVIARVAVEEILRKAQQSLRKPIGVCRILVRYTNLAGPVKLKKELKTLGRKASIPTHIYTGTLISEGIILEAAGGP